MWPWYKTQLPKAHIWSDSVFWVETEPCDVCIKVTFNLLTCPSPTLPSCSSNGYLSYVILLVFVWISYGCRLEFLSFEIFYRRSFQSVANRLPCKSLGVRFNILASLWRKVEASPRWCDPANSFKVGFVISTGSSSIPLAFGQALLTQFFRHLRYPPSLWFRTECGFCDVRRSVCSFMIEQKNEESALEKKIVPKWQPQTPMVGHHFQHRVLVFHDFPIHKSTPRISTLEPSKPSKPGRQNYLLG